MNTKPLFSERHGYQAPTVSITVRYEAPGFLRRGILSVALKSGFNARALRSIICEALDSLPDEAQNWSDPNVLNECEGLIDNCEWFEVYDICEIFARKDATDRFFEKGLNNFFLKKGIGWKMEGGVLSVRGEGDYEQITTEAKSLLHDSGRPTALNELKHAGEDLSKRPEPDVTGAIQHSMASLECLAREVSGSKGTLGAFIKDRNLPKPVDTAVEKMWAFASE
jgi:hypothetical protein